MTGKVFIKLLGGQIMIYPVFPTYTRFFTCL